MWHEESGVVCYTRLSTSHDGLRFLPIQCPTIVSWVIVPFPMFELFEDTFSSKALDEQPIYDPESARNVLAQLRTTPEEERFALEGVVQRILSAVIMHERFRMG